MTIKPNVPVVNAGAYYVNGLNMEYEDTKKIRINRGAARDFNNINDIILQDESIVIDGNRVGANGVDIDVFPNSGTNMYAVFIIGDSTAYRPTAGLLSLQLIDGTGADPVPVLPFGYDMYRRIGFILVINATIQPFYQYATDQTRMIFYDEPIQVLTAGTATLYNTVNLNNVVPDRKSVLDIFVDYTPNAATNIAEFTIGEGLGNAMVEWGMGVAARQRGSMMMPCSLGEGNAAFSYKVTSASDSLNLWVIGYTDYLAPPF